MPITSMPVLCAANRFTIPISSCTEGILRFAAKSADKNRWRWTKPEKRIGNPVDLLGNPMPRSLVLTKVYGPARSPSPDPVITNHGLLFASMSDLPILSKQRRNF